MFRALLLAATLVLLAACGDDADPTPAPTATPDGPFALTISGDVSGTLRDVSTTGGHFIFEVVPAYYSLTMSGTLADGTAVQIALTFPASTQPGTYPLVSEPGPLDNALLGEVVTGRVRVGDVSYETVTAGTLTLETVASAGGMATSGAATFSATNETGGAVSVDGRFSDPAPSAGFRR